MDSFDHILVSLMIMCTLAVSVITHFDADERLSVIEAKLEIKR